MSNETAQAHRDAPPQRRLRHRRFPASISASLRYAFVGYSQSDWASAHLVHAEGAARFGRVRAALGFTWQYDAPQITAPGSGVGDYSSLYLTGSIGYAF